MRLFRRSSDPHQARECKRLVNTVLSVAKDAASQSGSAFSLNAARIVEILLEPTPKLDEKAGTSCRGHRADEEVLEGCCFGMEADAHTRCREGLRARTGSAA